VSGVVVSLPAVGAAAAWRAHAAALLARDARPETVVWTEDGGDFFARAAPAPVHAGAQLPPAAGGLGPVLLHADPARFALAYRLLWRQRREPDVLLMPGDADVHRAERMAREVRRDMHHMKAFLRFRAVPDGAGERYVAWFEPEHHIVEAVAPFFARRFASMRWSILTPRVCARWDGERVLFSPGARREDAPAEDRLETAWSAYYAATFNPARVAPRAMLRGMPRKYWANMPETRAIPDLLHTARARADAMIARAPTPAGAAAAPKCAPASAPADDIGSMREALSACDRCALCRDATQVVPGEGPCDARVMLVGEQPGDAEDLVGRPFVGPAGRLLDEALRRCGVERAKLYVTNAVKHFKFETRGKRRLHKTPSADEIDHCRWWLDRERAALRPKLIVTLGATALRGVLGRAQAVSALRGQKLMLEDGARLIATVHPSYLLRLKDEEEKRREWRCFLDDLTVIRDAA
jgi:probable DNA metabolism protein